MAAARRRRCCLLARKTTSVVAAHDEHGGDEEDEDADGDDDAGDREVERLAAQTLRFYRLQLVRCPVRHDWKHSRKKSVQLMFLLIISSLTFK